MRIKKRTFQLTIEVSLTQDDSAGNEVDRSNIEEYKRDIHLRNRENFENIASMIEDAIEDIEGDQSLVQFDIQMATSDLQTAENVRSSAEKRLEQQRNDLTRNWAG